jgi:IS30 family transposase
MKKHNKITALERDHIAWGLACEVTIRDMTRRLSRSPCKVLNYQTALEVFTAEFRPEDFSKRTLFEITLLFQLSMNEPCLCSL